MQVKCLRVGNLNTNCYLLISKNELGIIDPGGDKDKILEEIKKTRAEPKYIINTHYHPDHVSANQEIKKETGAKILIHKNEKDFIDFIPDIYLEEGNEIKIGNTVLKVIHTPGHSAGSICLFGGNFIFTGDTLFEDGYGRTDFEGGSEKELKISLEKISQLEKKGITIYPGHGRIFKL